MDICRGTGTQSGACERRGVFDIVVHWQFRGRETNGPGNICPLTGKHTKHTLFDGFYMMNTRSRHHNQPQPRLLRCHSQISHFDILDLRSSPATQPTSGIDFLSPALELTGFQNEQLTNRKIAHLPGPATRVNERWIKTRYSSGSDNPPTGIRTQLLRQTVNLTVKIFIETRNDRYTTKE